MCHIDVKVFKEFNRSYVSEISSEKKKKKKKTIKLATRRIFTKSSLKEKESKKKKNVSALTRVKISPAHVPAILITKPPTK